MDQRYLAGIGCQGGGNSGVCVSLHHDSIGTVIEERTLQG